ncbi:octopamine receptor isoform X2 [Hydra vulgaris]|uniref:Octopamine receptor isoform X2 n=1 Tax=Hydra vulgaris TaxID=6087 RepID=A0ABM4CJW0_HYDVU
MMANRTDFGNTNDSIYLAIRYGIFSFFFILALFWNSLIIISVFRNKTLQKPINVLVCNLCLVDLFIVLMGIPLHASNNHILLQLNCNTFEPLLSAFVTANVFTLVTIAVERYVVVLNGIKSVFKLDLKRSIAVSILLDISAIIFSLPKVIFQKKVHHECCILDWPFQSVILYVLFLFLIQYLGPFLAMTFLYLKIWYNIRKKNKTSINLFKTNRISKKINSSSSINGIQFKSDSRNHLAIKNRRSGSLDSLYAYGSNTNKMSEPENTLRRSKSSSFVAENSHKNKSTIERSSSFTSNKAFHSHSLRGSFQRIHRSLTSVIVGADLDQAQVLFSVMRYKQTMKTLKVFFLLLFVFIVCLVPYQINNLIDLRSCNRRNDYLSILIYINAAVNPLLYGGLNCQFQRVFKKYFSHKPSQVQLLIRENMFHKEPESIYAKGSYKTRYIFCLKIKCFGKHKTRCPIERADARSLKMQRDSIRERQSISFYQNRKGSSKPLTENIIPVCAPIIIITCYDDEVDTKF